MGYDSVYRARAVKYEPPVVTAYVPQVFGQTAIEIVDAIGTPATGMGWVWFQGGNPEFPVWTSGLGGGGGNGNGGGGGGTVTDVLHVGPSAPSAADMELWYDTDEVAQFATMNDHWNTSWGVVARFPRLGSVSINALASITGNLSWTFMSGRRYRVVGYVRAVGTSAAGTVQFTLYDGSTALTQYGSNSHSYTPGNYGDVNIQWFVDGTGQTHTALNFKAVGVGQTAYMDAPSECYIEDIGPVTRQASDSPPPAGFDWTPYDSRYAGKTATETALAGLPVSTAAIVPHAVWEQYPSYHDIEVTKVGPIVVSSGLIRLKTGQIAWTTGTFATIPSGYRPLVGGLYWTLSTPGGCRVDVSSAGAMTLNAAPAVSIAALQWITINFMWTTI